MAIFWLPEEDSVAILFRYLFSGIGFLLTVSALYLPFNTLDVRVSEKQITRIRKWFGIVLKRQQIAPNELRHISIEKGARSSSNNKQVQYYRLVGHGPFGKFRFAGSIDDMALLETLKDKINEFAGIKPTT